MRFKRPLSEGFVWCSLWKSPPVRQRGEEPDPVTAAPDTTIATATPESDRIVALEAEVQRLQTKNTALDERLRRQYKIIEESEKRARVLKAQRDYLQLTLSDLFGCTPDAVAACLRRIGYLLRGYPFERFLCENNWPRMSVWSELTNIDYTPTDAAGEATGITLTQILDLPCGHSQRPTGLDFIPGNAQGFFTPAPDEIIGFKEGPNLVEPQFIFHKTIDSREIQLLVVRHKESLVYHFPCKGHPLYPAYIHRFIAEQLRDALRYDCRVRDSWRENELYPESTDRAFLQTRKISAIYVDTQLQLPAQNDASQMELVWIPTSRLLSLTRENEHLALHHAALIGQYIDALQPFIDDPLSNTTTRFVYGLDSSVF